MGNSYNGSQCYSYLTKNRWLPAYFALTALMVFLGSIGEVAMIWYLVDIVLVTMAIPHMAALVVAAYREPGAILNSAPAAYAISAEKSL